MAYVVSGTRFRALRARGAREAGFFFTDQFLLMRRFQRGITRPWEGSGSVFYSADRHPDRQTPRHGEETLRKYIYRYLSKYWTSTKFFVEVQYFDKYFYRSPVFWDLEFS